MTTSPNTDQCVAVSTTVSPFTHTADVAVNRAVIQLAGLPEVVASGLDSRAVPGGPSPRTVS